MLVSVVFLIKGTGQPVYKIDILHFDELEPLLHKVNDTTYIINFWATWCMPCRKELPEFEKIHKEYADQPVRVILISLDFPGQLESSLIPFLEKNDISARTILLDDPDSNSWIDRVDSGWTGSIPATLIYRNQNRKFLEEELDYHTLKQLISETNN